VGRNGDGRVLRAAVLMAVGILWVSACGGGDSSLNAATGSTAATTPSSQAGSEAPGSIAFQAPPGCNRAVSDGKDFLAVGCPGSISRIDSSNGEPRWSVSDPTWTEVKRLVLAVEVVVATVKVSVPASGLTARQEGDRVVALADGKKAWETRLSPTSDTHVNAIADLVVVDYSGERATGTARAGTVIAYEPQTGRVRFERPVDGAKCGLEGPMIFKSSVIACGQRFALPDGAALSGPGSVRILAADAASDIALGYESDVDFKILRNDGAQAAVGKGEFVGFAGDTIVATHADYNGKGGKVIGAKLDGSPRWEQTVTFDAQRWFFDNVSFANGAVWVRNGSDELVSIDGATGKTSPPMPARAAGLGKEAKVLASTASVLAVSTGDPRARQVATVRAAVGRLPKPAHDPGSGLRTRLPPRTSAPASAAHGRGDLVVRLTERLIRPARVPWASGASRTLAASAHSTVFTRKGRSSGLLRSG